MTRACACERVRARASACVRVRATGTRPAPSSNGAPPSLSRRGLSVRARTAALGRDEAPSDAVSTPAHQSDRGQGVRKNSMGEERCQDLAVAAVQTF
eukprot:4480837-Pleurochrysis_carterae.AAC.2